MKTFTDPRLCAAVVDRFTSAGQIIETGTAPTDSPRPGPPRHDPDVNRHEAAVELYLRCAHDRATLKSPAAL
jgi:hypothetical protein